MDARRDRLSAGDTSTIIEMAHPDVTIVFPGDNTGPGCSDPSKRAGTLITRIEGSVSARRLPSDSSPAVNSSRRTS